MNDVLVNVKKYINEQVSYYQKDIIDCYFEMFVDKVNEMCPKDKNYIKTIESVYRNKNSRKAMDILNKFFVGVRWSLLPIGTPTRYAGHNDLFDSRWQGVPRRQTPPCPFR